MRCLTLYFKGKFSFQSYADKYHQTVMFRSIPKSFCDVIYHLVIITSKTCCLQRQFLCRLLIVLVSQLTEYLGLLNSIEALLELTVNAGALSFLG